MKYIRQFFIILLVSFAGEILHFLIPAPIPASVYGLVLFFLCLQFRLIKLSQVEETSDFFLVLLPLTLVPLTVGLVDSLDVLRKVAVPAILLGVIGTILTAIAAGAAAEWTIRRRERSGK
ncbi:MAG: CidA/LrgA family protein [Thermoguttaceae bacterium]|jgi:holin-like protein